MLLLWRPPNYNSGATNKLFFITITAFYGATLFQCLPMPHDILSFLSTQRFQGLAVSQAVVGSPASWQSISYASLNSFGWWTFLLSLLILFLVLRKSFASPIKLNIIVGIMLGVAAVESLYGLIQSLIPNMGVLWVDYIKDYMGNARGTFINRNHFAGFIEMVWPLGARYHAGAGQLAAAVTDQRSAGFRSTASSFFNFYHHGFHAFSAFVFQVPGRHYRRVYRIYYICADYAVGKQGTAS